MDWKVVAHAEKPSGEALGTLAELTGLNRGELLSALRRGTLIAGTGLSRSRASGLARSLREEFGLEATALPAEEGRRSPGGPTLFRVVLTGYRPGNRARLRECLQRLSGLPPEQVVLWLSRIPFVLRDETDHETARKIRRAITEAGGMIDMRPVMDRPEVRPLQTGPEAEGPGEQAEAKAAGTEPPPAPASPPVASREPYRSSALPPRLCFLPPGRLAEVEAPPVIEEVGETPQETPPPEVRFRKPRSGFVPPPVLDRAEPRGPAETPPVIGFSDMPELDLESPPEPGTRFRLLLHRPSSSTESSVESALRSVLSMHEDETDRIMDRYPAWIASFGSRERAERMARSLELRGATVSVLREGESPPVLASARSGESFRKWIGSDG